MNLVHSLLKTSIVGRLRFCCTWHADFLRLPSWFHALLLLIFLPSTRICPLDLIPLPFLFKSLYCPYAHSPPLILPNCTSLSNPSPIPQPLPSACTNRSDRPESSPELKTLLSLCYWRVSIEVMWCDQTKLHISQSSFWRWLSLATASRTNRNLWRHRKRACKWLGSRHCWCFFNISYHFEVRDKIGMAVNQDKKASLMNRTCILPSWPVYSALTLFQSRSCTKLDHRESYCGGCYNKHFAMNTFSPLLIAMLPNLVTLLVNKYFSITAG